MVGLALALRYFYKRNGDNVAFSVYVRNNWPFWLFAGGDAGGDAGGPMTAKQQTELFTKAPIIVTKNPLQQEAEDNEDSEEDVDEDV
jgi:hypothetical protein